MPTRPTKSAKKPQGRKESPRPAKASKPEDPAASAAAFLRRLTTPRDEQAGGDKLNPAQRREVARRAARMSAAPEKAPGKPDRGKG
jgi:hypothetical protein